MTNENQGGECGAAAATPEAEIRNHVMNVNVAKSEGEWWAQREITRLQAELSALSRVSEEDLAILRRVIGVEFYAGSDEYAHALKRILAALSTTGGAG